MDDEHKRDKSIKLVGKEKKGKVDDTYIYERKGKVCDTYKSVYFQIWRVCLPSNGEEWRKGTCTCPSFLKNYICKHIIGMSIRLKYFKSPPEAKTVAIGSKRKRGRPCKAKKALLTQ